MPFPSSLKLITLSGDFRHGDLGDPREGVVTITLPTPIRSTGDNVIIPPFDIEVQLVDGTFAIEIPATTDPDWLPNTAEYVIQAVFTEDYRKLWWSFPLPWDTVDDALDLADVGAPNVGTPSVTVRQGVSQPVADGGYKGTWASGTLYRVGDTVQHGSAVYGALRPSTAITPGTDATVWKSYPSSGGGGAVDSVNGETGEVVLSASDVGAQPVNTDLTTIAALGPADDAIMQRKAGAWTGRTPAQVGADLQGSLTLAQSQVTGLESALTDIAADLAGHIGDTSNPHGVTKSQVGLANADNTSDANKPISTATQTALDGKASTSHTHAASAVVSGTLDIARIPTGQTGTTVPFGNDARFTDTRTPTDGSVTTAKIVDSNVTLAKLASIAAGTILGNNTGGAVAPIALTAAQVKTLLAIAQSDVTGLTAALAALAPLASPALTGTATAVNLTQSGRYVSTPDALVDAATIAVDASLGNDFTVTLGGNRTLGNPTNSVNGQKIMFAIRQDGTGNRTLTLGADYRLGTDITSVTLSTAAGKTDYLGVRYNGTDSKWDVIAFVKGY